MECSAPYHIPSITWTTYIYSPSPDIGLTPSDLLRGFTISASTATRLIASVLVPTFESVAQLMENRGVDGTKAQKVRDYGKSKFVPRYRALVEQMEEVSSIKRTSKSCSMKDAIHIKRRYQCSQKSFINTWSFSFCSKSAPGMVS